MWCYTRVVEEKYSKNIKYKERCFYEIQSCNIVFLGEKRVLTTVCMIINERGELIYIPAFNLILGKTKQDIENLLKQFAEEYQNA